MHCLISNKLSFHKVFNYLLPVLKMEPRVVQNGRANIQIQRVKIRKIRNPGPNKYFKIEKENKIQFNTKNIEIEIQYGLCVWFGGGGVSCRRSVFSSSPLFCLFVVVLFFVSSRPVENEQIQGAPKVEK